jgi:glycosyltransferase involved in cell wall biosynthesis
MKIAMIGQKGVPAHSGGVERHVEELSAELAARGHELLVFCRSWYTGRTEDEFAWRGMRAITVASVRTKHLDAITHTFLSIVRAAREKCDVFHLHGVGPALFAWLPKLLRPNAIVVVTFHCIDRHHKKWNVFARVALHLGEWFACRLPDATVAVAKTLQDYCRLSYGTDTMYIPNGTRLPSSAASAEPLSAFGLEPGQYLLFCARLVPHKGADLLVNAWKKLRAERPDLVGGKKLAIVGGGAFTDAYVESLTAACAGDDSIVMTGAQSGETLASLYGNAFALVHPSESEGMPLTVLEAMSYGKCVLASDIPENMELVEQHGMSFRRGNADDLVTKMAMLLETPELVGAVGLEARDHVAKRHDWSDIAETTEYLYEAIRYEPMPQVAENHLS